MGAVTPRSTRWGCHPGSGRGRRRSETNGIVKGGTVAPAYWTDRRHGDRSLPTWTNAIRVARVREWRHEREPTPSVSPNPTIAIMQVLQLDVSRGPSGERCRSMQRDSLPRTFPLPWPPGQEPRRDERVHAGARAARALDEARLAWLNQPDADEATLKKRTLTNLYNQRPTWLANLHAALDRAVWTACGWDNPILPLCRMMNF